jgi:phosphoglycolate phosphatase-like HAD superfamily hydrolase
MIIDDIEKIQKKVEQSEVLIFDFDGVIADSVEVKTKAFAEIYRPYGRDVVAKVMDHHKNNGGMSRFEKFEYYHKVFLRKNIDKSFVTELSNQFSDLVLEKVIASSEIPYVGDFLKKYCKEGRVCVINSATPQAEIQNIVSARGMDGIFSAVLGSPSSKVENINKILKKYNFSKSDVIFFGDAKADLMAALDTNINFIGIGGEIERYIRKTGIECPCIRDFSDIVKI